jgi:hypothetical protein
LEARLEIALNKVLRHWNAMSGAGSEDAEPTADTFEASFYALIDEIKTWYNRLEPKPQTLDEFLECSTIIEIVDHLPPPLYLNFETEADLIIDNIIRIDDEKYD